MSRHRRSAKSLALHSFAAFAAFAFFVSACGKQGPPLPPLVKLPQAPGNMAADRRGSSVDVHFTVPTANTDGSRPANVDRVDVYAITGTADLTDAELLKRATKIASVPVKAPRNPEQTTDPDEPNADIEPPEGKGLDQGATAHVEEQLGDETMRPYDPTATDTKHRSPATDDARPLLGPSFATASRTYAAVGLSPRGRKGPVSKRVAVPLAPAPPPPSAPSIAYDEKKITVTWTPVTLPGMVQSTTDRDVLPSTAIGVTPPKVAYNVYEVRLTPDTAGETAATEADVGVKLTNAPLTDAKYEDTRIAWGQRRCYVVRAVETINDLTMESDPSTPWCETLKDTFPPAAPANLQAVGSEGAISLIWDANSEKDLAGYVVFRGTSPDALAQVTPSPIEEAAFKDTVAPGATYTYAVKAVDKAGNASALSKPVRETAR